MKIAKIINDSTAEVKDHFTDVIFFQGCHRKCPYCFNKELIPLEGGENMIIEDILNRLSPISDVVVLTGGEPLLQYNIFQLIMALKARGKKIILETAVFSEEAFKLVDKAYFCVKTFERAWYNVKFLSWLNKFDNVEIVVVAGHPWFNKENYKKMLLDTKKQRIWIKPYNGILNGLNEIIRLTQNYHKKPMVMDKLVL